MLKSGRSREWLVLALGACWGGWSCTRLAEVDWSRIGTGDEGQGGEVAAQGGQQGIDEGGAPPSEGGVGGGLDEGGAGGESGSGPLAGGGGMAGSAGAAGGGGGGAAGMAGAGTGGMGGMGGGSAGEGPLVIIGGAAAIAGAMVLYDGGADAANGNYNGRTGLEQRCQTAKTALFLPHAKSAAFISVDGTDTLYDLPQNREVPKDKQIVSKTGVLLAENWVGLLGEALLPGRPNVSLKTAGVVAPSAKRWLSGSTTTGAFDTNGACDGWTKSTYDTIVQGRYGAVNTVTGKWLSDLRVACDVGDSHVLCLAFP